MVRKTSPLLRGFADGLTFSGFVRSSFETARADPFFPLVAISHPSSLAHRDRRSIGRGCEESKRKGRPNRRQPASAPPGAGSGRVIPPFGDPPPVGGETQRTQVT